MIASAGDWKEWGGRCRSRDDTSSGSYALTTGGSHCQCSCGCVTTIACAVEEEVSHEDLAELYEDDTKKRLTEWIDRDWCKGSAKSDDQDYASGFLGVVKARSRSPPLFLHMCVTGSTGSPGTGFFLLLKG